MVALAGMKKLISTCPALGAQPEFRAIMNLKGLDVISTRVWLDQSLPTRFPANVLAGFEPGVGGTYFNLTELQVSSLTPPTAVTTCPATPPPSLQPLLPFIKLKSQRCVESMCGCALYGSWTLHSIQSAHGLQLRMALNPLCSHMQP